MREKRAGECRSGRGGRRFESCHSDQHFSEDGVSLRRAHDFPIILSDVQSLFCGVRGSCRRRRFAPLPRDGQGNARGLGPLSTPIHREKRMYECGQRV